MMNARWVKFGLSAMAALLVSESALCAASGEDVVYKNLTLEERLYLFDGFGANWGVDVGSDGLWLVPQRPIPDTYSAPFKLSNNASDDTLVIGSDVSGREGNVGIGTDAPEEKLDVRGKVVASDEISASWSGSLAGGDGMKRVFRGVANNSAGGSYGSDAGFSLRNDVQGREWLFRTFSEGRGFSVTQLGTGGPEFYINNLTGDYRDAKMVLGSGFYVDENGQAHNASSRSYKENIVSLDSETAMNAFNRMQTVTYNFKKDASKEHMVGFIAEDVPQLVATKDRKTVDPLKIVALLNAVVHEQQEMLKTQAEKISELEKNQQELAEVKARLSALETVLTNIAHKETIKKEDGVALK